MTRIDPPRIRLSLCLALAGLCVSTPVAAETFQLVVPPGQEKLLGQMVGVGKAVFPGPCRLDSATTVKSVVRLSYRCGAKGQTVALMLQPPDFTGDALARTEKFALTPAPDAPADQALPTGFVDALATSIRAGEGRWHWMKVRGDHQAAQSHLLPTPPVTNKEAAQALDPRHVEMFEAGAALYREQKHAEALKLFLALARQNNRFGGVLGMIVANLAPTKPNAAKVAEYVATAEAAPDDLLAQYVAGVAAHYSAHYIADTLEQKRTLYETCIRFLDKTRPTLEFEPRVFIYLAVSHYRLGHQAEAEGLIEQAVKIAEHDPDAYYCRAEIFHRTDVSRSLDDLENYLVATRKFAAAGGWAADEKIQRVQEMRDYLRKVQSGEAALAEIFDPLASDTPGTVAPHVPTPAAPPSAATQALTNPQTYSRWVLLVGLLAALVFGLAVWLRRRQAPTSSDAP